MRTHSVGACVVAVWLAAGVAHADVAAPASAPSAALTVSPNAPATPASTSAAPSAQSAPVTASPNAPAPAASSTSAQNAPAATVTAQPNATPATVTSTTAAATVTAQPNATSTPPASTVSAPVQPKVIAVSGFSANPAAQAQAPAIESLIAGRLAQAQSVRVITQADLQTLVNVERQKELLGASSKGSCDESCMTELAGAVGAQYVLGGRVDRFGDTYVLAADVFDAHAARLVAKTRAEANGDAGLPDAANDVGNQVLKSLGVEAPATAPTAASEQAASVPHRFSLGLHVGNAFLANIANLNLSGDFEFGWQFTPSWVAFLQVGATLVRTENNPIPDQFGLVPSVIGVRRLYRIDSAFQPYWGLGLGVQLSVGNFGIGGKAIPLPSALGMVGFQYLWAERFSLGLEASTNVAQAFLGITQAGQGTGFNFDLNGTVAWRF